MATAGSVILELLARTGTFDTDIQRSTKAAEKRFKELENTAKTVGLAIGASLVAGAGALAVFFKQTVDGIDALNDVADATGSTIENISALEQVALQTGGSLEDVSSVLVRLNKVLLEDVDSDAAKALSLIGLSIDDLKKKDPADAVLDIAKALDQFADNGDKARIGTEILGKQYASMAPLLKDLAEKGKLNAAVTTEQAQAAEQFNKNIFELQANITGLARTLSGPLVTALNEVAQKFKEGRAAGKSFLEIGLENYRERSGQMAESWGLGIDLRPKYTGGASAGFDAPVTPKPTVKLPQLPGGNSKEEIDARAKAESDRAKAVVDAAKKQDDAFRSYYENLTRQLERTKELTTVEQLLADIQAGRLNGVTAGQRQRLQGVAAEIDAAKALEAVEKQREESQKRLNDSQREFRDYVDELRSQTRSPFETYLSGLEELQARLDLGIIDTDLFSQATKKLGDDFVASGEKAKEATDEFDEYAKQAQRNIQDALGDTLEDALSGNFDNIGKMWLQLIQRMAAQALAAQLNKQLFGDGQGSEGFISQLVKSGVNYFTAQSANGRAATGMDYVPYDGFKAVLHKGERVMTAADNRIFDGQAKGGGDTFTFGPTYVGSNVSLPDVDALVTARNRELEAKIIRSRKQQSATA